MSLSLVLNNGSKIELADATFDNNVWSPSDYPQGWQKLLRDE